MGQSGTQVQGPVGATGEWARAMPWGHWKRAIGALEEGDRGGWANGKYKGDGDVNQGGEWGNREARGRGLLGEWQGRWGHWEREGDGGTGRGRSGRSGRLGQWGIQGAWDVNQGSELAQLKCRRQYTNRAMRGHMGATGPAWASGAIEAAEATGPAGAMEAGPSHGRIRQIGGCFDIPFITQ